MPQIISSDLPRFDDMLGKEFYCPGEKATYRVTEDDRVSFISHWAGTREDGMTVWGIPCPCGHGFISLNARGNLVHL